MSLKANHCVGFAEEVWSRLPGQGVVHRVSKLNVQSGQRMVCDNLDSQPSVALEIKAIEPAPLSLHSFTFQNHINEKVCLLQPSLQPAEPLPIVKRCFLARNRILAIRHTTANGKYKWYITLYFI